MFKAVVVRVEKGESYYGVMGEELRRRDYPVASVLNWRLPLLLNAVAVSPKAARTVFVGLAALAVGLTLWLLLRHQPEVLLPSVLAQIGVAIALAKVPEYPLISEAWAGLLLLMSVAAYARNVPVAGAVIGVLAQ